MGQPLKYGVCDLEKFFNLPTEEKGSYVQKTE